MNSYLVRTDVELDILASSVPCGSTLRLSVIKFKAVMNCFIITFYVQVLCLMTTISDVEHALYSSLVEAGCQGNCMQRNKPKKT